jgi:hypothetical protein
MDYGLTIALAVVSGVLLEKYIIPILDLKFRHYSNTYNIKTLEQNCQVAKINNKQRLENVSTQKEVLDKDFDIALLERDIDDVRGAEIGYYDFDD